MFNLSVWSVSQVGLLDNMLKKLMLSKLFENIGELL